MLVTLPIIIHHFWKQQRVALEIVSNSVVNSAVVVFLMMANGNLTSDKDLNSPSQTSPQTPPSLFPFCLQINCFGSVTIFVSFIPPFFYHGTSGWGGGYVWFPRGLSFCCQPGLLTFKRLLHYKTFKLFDSPANPLFIKISALFQALIGCSPASLIRK